MKLPNQAHRKSMSEDTAPRSTRVRICVPSRIFLGYLFVFVVMLGPLISKPALAQSTESELSTAARVPAVVALASSFRTVWPALAEAYTAETGNPNPRTSFASSGLLSTQILHGAPFELYLSADYLTVQRVETAKKIKGPPFKLAQGKLSIIWRGSQTPTLREIGNMIRRDPHLKIAIANPRHAPYGMAAEQALAHADVTPLATGKLLKAENASQALQYALNGAVDVAIVPTTLTQQKLLGLKAYPVDNAAYDSVVHYLVLLQSAGEAATALSEWLKMPNAKSIMQRFGLTAP